MHIQRLNPPSKPCLRNILSFWLITNTSYNQDARLLPKKLRPSLDEPLSDYPLPFDLPRTLPLPWWTPHSLSLPLWFTSNTAPPLMNSSLIIPSPLIYLEHCPLLDEPFSHYPLPFDLPRTLPLPWWTPLSLSPPPWFTSNTLSHPLDLPRTLCPAPWWPRSFQRWIPGDPSSSSRVQESCCWVPLSCCPCTRFGHTSPGPHSERFKYIFIIHSLDPNYKIWMLLHNHVITLKICTWDLFKICKVKKFTWLINYSLVIISLLPFTGHISYKYKYKPMIH